MNRIDATFARLKSQGRTALIPYVTTGDPSLAATRPIMDALVAGGADVIELGVPFSDPMADGPVIQRASERALAQHVGLADVLAVVAEFRRANDTTPVVLMGYANPIEAMGVAAFAERAHAAGVDGVLVVDYPPEEAADFAAAMATHDIAPIFLLSPTTPESRVETVARLARGYVYYVSLKGVTGAGHLDVGGRRAQARRDPPARRAAGRRGLRHSRRGERAGDRRARRRRRDRQPHHPGDRVGARGGRRFPRRRLAWYHPSRARRDGAQGGRLTRRKTADGSSVGLGKGIR